LSKEIILAGCSGDSWQFKYGVISTIKDDVLVNCRRLVLDEDGSLSSVLCDILLGIFGVLDKQAEQLVNSGKDLIHVHELMGMVVDTLVSMIKAGFATMRDQARTTLINARLMLDDNKNDDDRRQFERFLMKVFNLILILLF